MIRINLLPVKERKQTNKGLGEFVLGVLAIVAAFAVIVAVHIVQEGKIAGVKMENKKIAKRITELEDVKKKVEEFKLKNKELERRIEVINVLEENRTGPLFVMDALSDAIPERAWVDKFSEKSFSAKVDGIAWNEFTVADFMKSLQASPYFQNVQLGVIKKKGIRNLPLRSFVIEAKLNYSGKTKKEDVGQDEDVNEANNHGGKREAKR